MKKLYMIRLENGNSVIVQAENQDTALQHAGLRVDPAAQAAAMGEKDVASLHLTLVHEGLGPQNYTIRELDDFLCMAHLEDNGDFDLTLESGESSDEFYIDYPCLRAAEEKHLLRRFTDPSFDNPEVRKLYEDAVEGERTRLLVSGRDSGK